MAGQKIHRHVLQSIAESASIVIALTVMTTLWISDSEKDQFLRICSIVYMKCWELAVSSSTERVVLLGTVSSYLNISIILTNAL